MGAAQKNDEAEKSVVDIEIEKIQRGAMGPHAIKARIVQACEIVLAHPEQNIDWMDFLLRLSDMPNSASVNDKLRRMALISAAMVFKDIIPGYKMNPPSKYETMKLKTDVRANYAYETKFLRLYKDGLLKRLRNRKNAKGLCILATGGACEFNHADTLISALIGVAGGGSKDAQNAIKDLLSRTDDSMRASEVSKIVVQTVGRERQPARLDYMVSLLRHCPTDCAEHMEALIEKGIPVGTSYDDPEDPENPGVLRKQLEVGALRGSKESLRQLRKTEAEILAEIFVVYLRVLRAYHLHSVECVQATLEGLSFKASDVNLELMVEIQQEIRKVVTAKLQKKAALPSDISVAGYGLIAMLALTRRSVAASALETSDAAFLRDAIPRILREGEPDLACRLCQEVLLSESQSGPEQLAAVAEGLLDSILLDPEAGQSAEALVGLMHRRPAVRPCLDREGAVMGFGQPFNFYWKLLALRDHVVPGVSVDCFPELAAYSADLKNEVRRPAQKPSADRQPAKKLSADPKNEGRQPAKKRSAGPKKGGRRPAKKQRR